MVRVKFFGILIAIMCSSCGILIDAVFPSLEDEEDYEKRRLERQAEYLESRESSYKRKGYSDKEARRRARRDYAYYHQGFAESDEKLQE